MESVTHVMLASRGFRFKVILTEEKVVWPPKEMVFKARVPHFKWMLACLVPEILCWAKVPQPVALVKAHLKFSGFTLG